MLRLFYRLMMRPLFGEPVRTALTVIASSAPEHDALPVRMAVRLVAGLSDSKEDK